MQLIVIESLRRYGYARAARRIAYKFLDVVAKNFLEPVPTTYEKFGETRERSPGRLYEKYDVTSGHLADEEYPSNAMMGWSAAVFAYAYDYVQQDAASSSE